MASDMKFQAEILRIIASASMRGVRKSDLLDVLGHVDIKRFKRIFKSLLAEKIIEPVRGDAFRLTVPAVQETPDKTEQAEASKTKNVAATFQGQLSVSPNGYGFVKVEHFQSDVFIPPEYIGAAVSGDTVIGEITEADDPRGLCGRILEIVKRQRENVVGCLWRGNRGDWFIRPLRRELPSLIQLTDSVLPDGMAAGDWVEVRLSSGNEADLRGEIVKRVNESGNVTGDLDAIVWEYQLEKPYSPAQNSAAKRIRPLEPPREDCTALTVVTIDPVDARDYDDALSCQPGEKKGTVVVGVHIADVACYVKRNSQLDKHARTRGFTSYLPGRTLPMLPAALANDLCSLKEGVPRLAHSVFMTIELKSGKILSWRRCHTTICSARRCCYDEVAEYLDTRRWEAPDRVRELVDNLASAAEALQTYRVRNEMYLPMDMPEIRAVCTENPPQILGVQKSVHNFAHQLVEEFMLAANQCVAIEMTQKKIPGLFRNHPGPLESSMMEFAGQASGLLGKTVKPFRKRGDLVNFLNRIEDETTRDFISMMLLRHLERAFYSNACEGHFGLGKEFYCHFTSPIRRYTDTTVHQQLLDVDMGRRPRPEEKMQELGVACSALEENNDQAAFAASDRMKIRFLQNLKRQRRNFRVYGTVMRTAKAGVTVYLSEYGLMAFVTSKSLPGVGWLYDSKKYEWVNRRTKKTVGLQDRLELTIADADPVRGELLLNVVK